MMFAAYPRFKLLTALCGTTLLVSLMTFTFAQTKSQLPPGSQLNPFPGPALAAPIDFSPIAPNLGSVQLPLNDLLVEPELPLTKPSMVGAGGAQGEIGGDSVPREVLAQASVEIPSGEPDLQSLGMGEGGDPALQQLAMAEPGSILTALALSEAAAGSSLLPLALGGLTAAGVGQAVSSLVQAEPDDVPPVSF